MISSQLGNDVAGPSLNKVSTSQAELLIADDRVQTPEMPHGLPLIRDMHKIKCLQIPANTCKYLYLPASSSSQPDPNYFVVSELFLRTEPRRIAYLDRRPRRLHPMPNLHLLDLTFKQPEDYVCRVRAVRCHCTLHPWDRDHERSFVDLRSSC